MSLSTEVYKLEAEMDSLKYNLKQMKALVIRYYKKHGAEIDCSEFSADDLDVLNSGDIFVNTENKVIIFKEKKR